MSWRCYEVEYRAESPVHIGWHQLGQIRRTRRFIPSRNVWGAWTAAWARRGSGFESGKDPYASAEGDLDAWLRFTPLFPKDAKGRVLRPRYDGAGLRYGDLTAGEFDARYVHGVTSTVIEPVTFTAQDGMLHEREYLHGRDLTFTGYVLARDDRWEGLWEHTAVISVGGNQGYGYGLLRGRREPRKMGDGELLFDDYRLDPSTGRLEGKEKAALADFADARTAAEGEMEAVGGRRQGKRGAGQDVSEVFPEMWSPGSILRENAKFEIERRGGWLKVFPETSACLT